MRGRTERDIKRKRDGYSESGRKGEMQRERERIAKRREEKGRERERDKKI